MIRKLANYELANLAAWAFDFDRENSLFNAVIENSSEKTDLLGTWGAIEGALIMGESKLGSWTPIQEEAEEKEITKPYLRRPVIGLIEEHDRVTRFESFIAAKEKEILRNLQRSKLRLRELRNDLGDPSSQRLSGTLARKINEPWFIAVQRLAAICIGRAYRRDGEVPDMRSVQRALQGTKLVTKNSDDRCVVVTTESLSVEVWFDGRICCTGAAERFDDVVTVLELMTKVSDSAIALANT
jgi:hypothetical protein